MPKSASFSLRIDPEIHEAIKAEAAAQDRSVAYIIAKILKDWVDGQAKPAKGKSG